MFIEVNENELNLIIHSIFSNNEYCNQDTSLHKDLLNKLNEYLRGYRQTQSVYLVSFDVDNGAIEESYISVCMAFDEDDAAEIIKNNYCSSSYDSVEIKSVRKFTENDILREKF